MAFSGAIVDGAVRAKFTGNEDDGMRARALMTLILGYLTMLGFILLAVPAARRMRRKAALA